MIINCFFFISIQFFDIYGEGIRESKENLHISYAILMKAVKEGLL